jgi:hypothetical protein
MSGGDQGRPRLASRRLASQRLGTRHWTAQGRPQHEASQAAAQVPAAGRPNQAAHSDSQPTLQSERLAVSVGTTRRVLLLLILVLFLEGLLLVFERGELGLDEYWAAAARGVVPGTKHVPRRLFHGDVPQLIVLRTFIQLRSGKLSNRARASV